MVEVTGRSDAGFWLKHSDGQALFVGIFLPEVAHNKHCEEEHTLMWLQIKFVPAHSTTVSAVHQENRSQSSGHAHVRRLPDQNHDGLRELKHQHTRLYEKHTRECRVSEPFGRVLTVVELPSPWSSCVGWRCRSLTIAVSCITRTPPSPKPAAPAWRGPAEAPNALLQQGSVLTRACVCIHSRRRPNAARARRVLRKATASWGADQSAAPSCRRGGCGWTGKLPGPLHSEDECRTYHCSLPPFCGHRNTQSFIWYQLIYMCTCKQSIWCWSELVYGEDFQSSVFIPAGKLLPLGSSSPSFAAKKHLGICSFEAQAQRSQHCLLCHSCHLHLEEKKKTKGKKTS